MNLLLPLVPLTFLVSKLRLSCTRSDENTRSESESVVNFWTFRSGSCKHIHARLHETDREKCSAFDYGFSFFFYLFFPFPILST